MGEVLPAAVAAEVAPAPAAVEAEATPEGGEPAVEEAPAEPEAAEAAGEPESAPAAEVEAGEPSAGEPEPAEAAAEAPAGEEPALAPETTPEALATLAAGTVIAGRYLLAELLDAQPGEIRYLAHDLQRCRQCGFEGNSPGDGFCARCGASLDRRPDLHLLQVRSADAAPSSGEPVVERLAHEGQFFLLLALPKAEPDAAAALAEMRFAVGARTDPGQTRELNEDSLLVLTLLPIFQTEASPLWGLFAVADGMGGHEGGEVASKLTLQTLGDEALKMVAQELSGPPPAEDAVVERLRRAVNLANDAVFLARQKTGTDMGSTLTAALIRDGRLFLAHVGDCRAFRWSAAGLEQLTADHSLVAGLIASGRAQPDEIYTHPHRSVITRCIGDQPVVEVDTQVLDLAVGDRLLLCSDGLWEMVRNTGIEEALMQEADPQAACELLVNRANVAGGEDNISVVVIQMEAA